jgi:phage tail sheath gpL-like
MPLIPITGVPSTFKVPGQYAEIVFAQGPSSAAAGERTIMHVMPILSGNDWSAATVYGPIKNEQEAIDGAGAGSPAHRAVRATLAVNKNCKVYVLPVDETTGGAPVAATATVTWTTDPTGTGVASVWVCGELCSAGYDDNDTVTTVAAAMKAAINAKTHLPCDSDNVAGVLTLTAKLKGTSQGTATVGVIRVRAEVTVGTGISVATSGAALGMGTGTPGAEGSTTEAANTATSLAAVTAARYYYMGTSHYDATGQGALVTHISAKSEPLPGLRSVGIAASVDSLANGITLATGHNYERLQIVWQPNSEADMAHLVGVFAGIRQKYEELDSAYNFDSFRKSAEFPILAPDAVSDWPDVDDQNDAINGGLTPIASDQTGSYLVMSCTTRSKDSGGTVDDPRALETHRVSVADEYTDTVLLNHTLSYGGKKLRDDRKLADGSVDSNQKLGRNVVTPSTYKPFIRGYLDAFADVEKIQEVAASKEGLRCVIDPNNSGRLEVGHDLHVIDLLHQTTFRIAEVSSG